MKLKTLTTINWSNIPDKSYEFANVNLFSGDSGAGKTTLLDALQTILSAAMRSIYQFNPAQEEVKQSSQKRRGRSLESYALGGDQELFSRDQSITYISATFAPEAGEKSELVTAIISVKAHLTKIKQPDGTTNKYPKLDEQKLFIIKGHELSKFHFLSNSNEVVSPEDLTGHLRDNYKIVLPKGLDKKTYLASLYASFHGKTIMPNQDAQRSAKGLLKCMAYKPLQSIDKFVKTEVFEPPKGLETVIEQIRGMIKDINTLKREAAVIKESADHIQIARHNLRQWVSLVCHGKIQNYLDLSFQSRKLKQQILNTEDDLTTVDDEQLEAIDKGTELQGRLELIQSSLADVSAKIVGDNDLANKEILKKELTTLNLNLQNTIAKIHSEMVVVQSWIEHIEKGSFLINLERTPASLVNFINEAKNLINSCPKIISISDISSPEHLSEYQSAFAGYDKFINSAAHLAERYENDIVLFYSEVLSESRRYENVISEINDSLTETDNELVKLPQDLVDAVALITHRIPEANASIVCKHIDIKEPSWQWAIEAFLGRDRFCIVVEPGFEVESQQLIASKGFQVLQSTRLINSKSKIVGNNLAQLIECNSPIVSKFIDFKLGSIKQIDDKSELESVPKGIMKDGLAAMGYKIFQLSMPHSNLILGESASKARREHLLEQKLECTNELTQLQLMLDYVVNLKSLFKLPSQIYSVDAYNSAKNVCQSISETEYKLQIASETKSSSSLLEKQESLKSDQKKCNALLLENARLIGSFDKKMEQIKSNILSMKSKLSELDEQKTIAKADLDKFYAATNHPDIEKVEEWSDKLSEKTVRAVYPYYKEVTEYYTQSYSCMQKMDKSIIEFNKSDSQLPIVSNLSGKHEAFITKIHDSKGTDYAPRYPSDLAEEMESLLHSLDDKFELLDGHILNKKMASLNEMGEQFKKTFICDLCFHVYGHIREGAQYLSMLNSKLKGFFFGGDSFQFSYKTHPEMKMYNKFFEIMSSLVSDIKEIDDLEQHLEDLSPDALDTYLELRNSLLDDDEVRAQRTLLKIMDYREYFLVDILKYRKTDSGLSAPISLDEDATGSGGQLETSAYVIRSAGLVGALGCDKEQSSLKLMMIDEAFNKSDNTRVRAIIQYLSETLGFQLLIAMPTRSTSSLLSEFDKLFLVTKQNNSASPVGTNTYVNEKYLNKEAIKDLWEKSKIKIENNTIASFMDKVS